MGLNSNADENDANARRDHSGADPGLGAHAGRVGGNHRIGAGGGGDVARRLAIETEQARQIIHALRDDADDEQLLADAIEVETSLPEAIDAALARLAELEAHSEALKQQMTALAARSGRFSAQGDRIREALMLALLASGQKRVERAVATVSIASKPAAVVITDEAALPSDMLRHRPPEPDKRAIKAAIDRGEMVPGALLGSGGVTLKINRK